MLDMKHKINGIEYDVVIEKKHNKNLYIRVKKDGKIYVSCPLFTSKSYIKRLLNENEDQISKMISRQAEQQKRDEEFYYLGQKYDIIIVPTLDKIEWKETRIYAPSKKKLDVWCDLERRRIFQERYEYIYQNFNENVLYPKLKIRSMKTRWGVCNRKSETITLNAKLLSYPLECLDYVIVHELCHLVHFDHSKNFWNLVGVYCPEYKRIRKILKG